MRLFRSRGTKDWENSIRVASDEELTAETWRLTQEIRAIRKKKLKIKEERDRRLLENPPERGQVVKVGQ